MQSMNRVWRQSRLQLQTKLCLYQTCVVSILLYGSEAWTLLQEHLRKLEAFHMRFQRIILGIRWHDFVRNTEVANTINLPCIKDIITKRRNSLFGKTWRPHASPSRIVTGRCNPNWLLPSRLAPANMSPTQLVASSNRRRHTFWHSCGVDQGSQSWTQRDWVDATDLCRLCDLMMMMRLQRQSMVDTAFVSHHHHHRRRRCHCKDLQCAYTIWTQLHSISQTKQNLADIKIYAKIVLSFELPSKIFGVWYSTDDIRQWGTEGLFTSEDMEEEVDSKDISKWPLNSL